MFWASKRVATRAEDLAYSLLGIFDINMPPLYGEGGSKAFARLQEEIILHTQDPTLLYWQPEDTESQQAKKGRLFARSPSDFGRLLENNLSGWPKPTRFSLSNIGLEVEGALVRMGPLTYALELAESFPSGASRLRHSLLLLRKPTTFKEMQKLGIWSSERPLYLSSDMLPLRRHRNITIIRDPYQDLDFGHQKLPQNFTLNIEIDTTITSSFLGMKYGEPPIWRTESCNIVRKDGGVQWIVGVHEPPSTASIQCLVEGGDRFIVDLAFDFECYPCALFTREKTMTCVWQASEAIPRAEGPNWDPIPEVFHTVKDIADGLSYLFRASSSLERSKAKVPSGFICTSKDVWAGFDAPHDTGYYWSFRLWTRNK